MTAYLTAVGTQQFSITIASGSLTGTATINAVGSGAFILYQGCNGSDTTAGQLDDTDGYLTLTNSTTITATRGVTGSSKTSTINGVIIDGDTTNLIKTVQFGTVTIAASSGSGTASITAVTNANTAIAYLGEDSSATLNNIEKAAISLSGTTVTATLATGNVSTGTTKVGFCVIEFQGAALNQSVQNVSRNVTGTGTSGTVTITSVNVNNAMLIYGGHAATVAAPNTGYQYGVLTNGTTVTVNWNTTASTQRIFNCCVVEFVAGVFAQSAQRNTIALSAATSNTATITSVNTANAAVAYLGNSTTNTSVQGALTEYQAALTNATTVTASVATAGSGTLSFEAYEFTGTGGGFTAVNRRTIGPRVGSRSYY